MPRPNDRRGLQTDRFAPHRPQQAHIIAENARPCTSRSSQGKLGSQAEDSRCNFDCRFSVKNCAFVCRACDQALRSCEFRALVSRCNFDCRFLVKNCAFVCSAATIGNLIDYSMRAPTSAEPHEHFALRSGMPSISFVSNVSNFALFSVKTLTTSACETGGTSPIKPLS